MVSSSVRSRVRVRVRSGQVRAGQVWSGRSGQVGTCWVRSGRVGVRVRVSARHYRQPWP